MTDTSIKTFIRAKFSPAEQLILLGKVPSTDRQLRQMREDMLARVNRPDVKALSAEDACHLALQYQVSFAELFKAKLDAVAADAEFDGILARTNRDTV